MLITLVGSVKQEEAWRMWTRHLTIRGHLVFEAGNYGTLGVDIVKEDWDKTTKVHHEKIRKSDLVLVIPKADGTIGTHTWLDISVAREAGIPVFTVFDYDSRFNDTLSGKP